MAYWGGMFKSKIIAGKVNKTNSWNPPGHLLIPNQGMFLELVQCKCTGTLLFFVWTFQQFGFKVPVLIKRKMASPWSAVWRMNKGKKIVFSTLKGYFHVHLQRTAKSKAYWLGVAGITQRAQHTFTHWSSDNLLTFLISHSASCIALFIICCILTGSVSSQWLA